MPHKPQPVPPKIHSELPARAGRWTGGHMLRETFFTLSSIDAAFANRMARVVLDPDPVRERRASPQLEMRHGQASCTGLLTAACIRRRLANH